MNDVKTEQNVRQTEQVKELLQKCENLASPQPEIEQTELQEVYQNALTGKYAVENLRPIAQDRGFRNLLLKEYKEYSALAKEIEMYADCYSMQLHGVNVFARGMMYFTTMINTVKDKSNSKLAEIMIQGLNMGIISLNKVINKKEGVAKNAEFAERMLSLLEQNLNDMKLFLR